MSNHYQDALGRVEIAGGCTNPVWTVTGFQRCRQCAVCRRYDVWQWVRRTEIEQRRFGRVVFATWTFRPRGPYWDPTLENCREEVTRVFKRARHRYPQLRYLSATEFGSLNGRVHQHSLITGLPTAKASRGLWKQGYTHARWAKRAQNKGEPDDFEYVCKYAVEEKEARKMVSLGYGSITKKDIGSADVLKEIFRYFPKGKVVGLDDIPMPYDARSRSTTVLRNATREERKKPPARNQWLENHLNQFDLDQTDSGGPGSPDTP